MKGDIDTFTFLREMEKYYKPKAKNTDADDSEEDNWMTEWVMEMEATPSIHAEIAHAFWKGSKPQEE